MAKAFAKWCNAAGGINGRKIVIDKHDAKLFNGAQQILDACQRISCWSVAATPSMPSM